MMPPDFTLYHGLTILFLLLCWFTYPILIRLFGIDPLNTQLTVARRQWVHEMANRPGKPFDAILIGHLVHSVAFFGSATLLVLAGLLTTVVKLESIHQTVGRLHFIEAGSLELFVMQFGLLFSVLTICFFSFTYALRKLLYSIALIGALPDKPEAFDGFDEQVEDTTTVLGEALKTFNFGIRGYYYAVAALFLFASPMLCMLATFLATSILLYRQVRTPTSKAISRYVGRLAKRP